jgi:hypothetical protein
LKGTGVVNGQNGKRRATAVKAEPAEAATVVGGYVNAACGKCKAMTSHIILAKVGARPTRVECRTCHAMHAYRASTSTRAASSRAAEPSPEEVWTNSMRQARGATVPYATSGHYAVGARLKHPSFGEGVVARLASATVCEVVFAKGTVKLIMGAGSTTRTPRG